MNRFFLLTTFLALILPYHANAGILNEIEELKENYNKIFDDMSMEKNETIKDFRKSLGNVLNCAGAEILSSKCDFNENIKVLSYTAKLRSLQDATVKLYDNIKEFEKSDYEDKDEKEVEDYKTYMKNLANMFNAKNAKLRSAYVEGIIPTDVDTFDDKIRGFENDVENSWIEFKKTFRSEGKKKVSRLETAKGKLEDEIDFSQVTASEIHKKIEWRFHKCKENPTSKVCIEKAGEYMAALSTKDQTLQSLTVINRQCELFDAIGNNGMNMLMDLFSASWITKAVKSIDEKGLDHEDTMKYAALLRTFGGKTSADNPVVAKYAKLLDPNYGNVTINPDFATSGAGTGVSMQPGGGLVSNPFTDTKYDAYKNVFANLASSNFLTTATGKGADSKAAEDIGVASLGSDQHLNVDQAVSLFKYNTSAISATGGSATTFNKKYESYLTKLSSDNQQFQQLVATPIPSIYTERAKSAKNSITVAEGGRGETPYGTVSSSVYMRERITQLRAQKEELVNVYIELIEEAGISQYKIEWGNKEERANAAYQLGKMAGIKSNIYAQLAAIDAEIALYGMGSYIGIIDSIFNLGVMYAAEGKRISVERSLKIKDLKTSVDVRFDKDWFVRVRKYVQEMLKKADNAKRQMNKTKIELRKLLKKQVPLIPLAKLPLRRELAREIKNMEALGATGKKNMKAIDKAMGYHKDRRRLTPPGLYKKYLAESKKLKESINTMVSAIDESNDDIKKSYIMLNKLSIEVPKAIALRRIAKEMVKRGL